jgi:3-oxoacyl-[acyl-carrier protein] reductase
MFVLHIILTSDRLADLLAKPTDDHIAYLTAFFVLVIVEPGGRGVQFDTSPTVSPGRYASMIRYAFPNKVALVTGSSRGIGAAILEGFAAAGATCVLHYWNDPDGVNRADAAAHAQTLRSAGAAGVHVFDADVRNPAEVERMFGFVRDACGGLDILVNNAGIVRDKTLRKMAVADWDAVIATNLSGVFHGCKFAAELLRDGGRIINISSVSGLYGLHGQTNYAAAKAGVIGMTRVLAKEFARRQITVNALAPGLVQTTLMGDLRPEVLEEYTKNIPLGRLAQPTDIANVALFLASEEASYITGQTIPVNGGWLL